MAKSIRGEFNHMDGGPFRVPQSSERRSTPVRQSSSQAPSRSSTPPSKKEEVASLPRKGRTSPVSNAGSHATRSSPRLLLLSSLALGVLLVGVAVGWGIASYGASVGVPALDGGRYQAVSLANGQTYFGKLTPGKGGYVVLRDIYYLQEQAAQQSSGEPDAAAGTATSAQLTKRGEAVYGPDDEMVISKDQIFFIENLKKDSAVVKLIEEYQQSE